MGKKYPVGPFSVPFWKGKVTMLSPKQGWEGGSIKENPNHHQNQATNADVSLMHCCLLLGQQLFCGCDLHICLGTSMQTCSDNTLQSSFWITKFQICVLQNVKQNIEMGIPIQISLFFTD